MKVTRSLPTLVLALSALAARCAGERRGSDGAVIEITDRAGVDLDHAVIEPRAAVRAVERRGRRLMVTVDRGAVGDEAISLRAPGACPKEVRLGEGAKPVEVSLAPWIDVGEDRPQIGFDTAFEIEVVPGCREATAGRVVWRQIEGEPLPEMRAEKNGYRLRGRTRRFVGDAPSWGIVPLSPATRGAVTLEAVFRGIGPEVRRVIRLAAAARAAGVPSIALGQRVLLSGVGWQVEERPTGGHAMVGTTGAAPSFQPDASGRWVLADETGATLALRVGRHSDTPLDCGRAECHASAARAAEHSRMTRVLALGLAGAFGPTHDVSCTLACHAVGEPGLPDGGFAQISNELGARLPPVGPEAWSALPRALRRLGGVGCTACHGPGAIPEREARWTILRTGVCAVCHDSPPRYGHVAAWQSTRMARADRNGEARRDPVCAGCHTTAGFLAAIGARPRAASEGAPDGPLGLGCVVCHAPHAAGTERALLRVIPPPEGLEKIANLGASAVCLRCHAAPAASAANLWSGRIPGFGEVPAPHAKIENGCLGCHAGGPVKVTVERGAGHAFQVDRARCQPCHDCPKEERLDKEGRSVRARAEALYAAVRKRGIVKTTRPWAPHAGMVISAAPGTREARAATLVLTVVEDPAAAAHNAGAARALLDEAEALLGRR